MEVFMKFSHKSLLLPFVIFLIQSESNLFTHPIAPPTKIEEVVMADELFKQMTSQKPTVIMSFMNNCPHCKTVTKFFETLPKKYNKINFVMVNGPKLNVHKEVAKLTDNHFRIPGYPSIVFIKNGKIKDIQIGGNPKTLEDKIKILLK
jgi:thiol-disulfide isomerase/thioredoxin